MDKAWKKLGPGDTGKLSKKLKKEHIKFTKYASPLILFGMFYQDHQVHFAKYFDYEKEIQAMQAKERVILKKQQSSKN